MSACNENNNEGNKQWFSQIIPPGNLIICLIRRIEKNNFSQKKTKTGIFLDSGLSLVEY